MKTLFALMLVGSMLLVGCSQKTVTNEQTMEEAAPAPEQEAPLAAAAEESSPPVVALAPEPADDRMADKIFFDFNSHRLSSVSKKALEGHALWLQTQPEVRIVIEGHADERGSTAYNLALGKRRAEAARAYLVRLGVAPERLSIVSYGEEKATRGAANEIIWAQDRRAEFVAAN